MKHSALILLLLLPGMGVANPALEKLRKTFETHHAPYADGLLGPSQAIQDKYRQALESMQKKFSIAGNLSAVLAVKSEIQRAEKTDGQISRDTLVSSPPELAKLQKAYLAGVEKGQIEAGRKLIALVESYDRSLEKLQRNLTQSQDLEAAVAVRAERDRVREDKAYRSAVDRAEVRKIDR
ncbi:MAG: hypothetical protein AAF492_28795, partial [Verrucomicrobiota bacterium]